MRIIEADDFRADLDQVPAEIRRLYYKQKKIFAGNWLDTRLHTKRLKEFSGAFSFRITRRYRVIFYIRDYDAIFFKIGHRKDIYE